MGTKFIAKTLPRSFPMTSILHKLWWAARLHILPPELFLYVYFNIGKRGDKMGAFLNFLRYFVYDYGLIWVYSKLCNFKIIECCSDFNMVILSYSNIFLVYLYVIYIISIYLILTLCKYPTKNTIKSNNEDARLVCECKILLTHFSQMLLSYTSWKHRETRDFLCFPGGIEMKHWP